MSATTVEKTIPRHRSERYYVEGRNRDGMASRKSAGPLGWASQGRHPGLLGSGALPGPLGAGWHPPMLLPEDSWHPPMLSRSRHSEADLALGLQELRLLREFYGNVVNSDASLAYAVFGPEGWSYRVEEYLAHRDSFFGSKLAYESYLRIAHDELEANAGRLRKSIVVHSKLQGWQSAQDVFYAWTRRAYENKLGPDANIPALISANTSEKLKLALRQVQID